MLTKDVLVVNSALSTLTEEQIAAIETLSKNDEQRVIDTKVQEIHSRYDNDIKEVTGLEKSRDVKSYTFLKDVLSQYKTKADEGSGSEQLKEQIAALEAEKKALADKVKKGEPDNSLQTRVVELEREVQDKSTELEQIRAAFTSKEQDLMTRLKDVQGKAIKTEIERQIETHMLTSGLGYNDAIPESVIKQLSEQRKTELLSKYQPQYVEGEDGKETLVFRSESGDILRNQENGLRPYTAGELYEQSIKDILKPGRKVTGNGVDPKPSVSPRGAVMPIHEAKSQVEADELIKRHVIDVEKIDRTSRKYGLRVAELRKEAKVADLPFRSDD